MDILTINENFSIYDWFTEAVSYDDQYVFYVRYMSGDVFNEIPEQIDDKKVLIHFNVSRFRKDNNIEVSLDNFEEKLEALPFNESDLKVIDTLVLECGANILEDIFYEVLIKIMHLQIFQKNILMYDPV